MSGKSEAELRNECQNVDVQVKESNESVLQNKSVCDPEHETVDLESPRSATSVNSDTSSTNPCVNDKKLDSSPEIVFEDVQTSLDLLSMSSELNNFSEVSISSDEGVDTMESFGDCKNVIPATVLLDELPDNCVAPKEPCFSEQINNVDHKKNISDLSANNLETSNNLRKSTTSLNELSTHESKLANVSSQHSKSAENISIEINEPKIKTNTSETNLDTKEILLQFANQKTKVSATQKIIPQHLNDAKYTRMHKEILSPDIGSIVKNVHSIFSSVSGSLKNAYSNTNKGSVQKLLNNVTPLPHSRLTPDIIKEESEPIIFSANPKKPLVSEGQIVNGTAEKHLSTELIIHTNTEIEEQNGVDKEYDHKKDVLKLQIESLEKLLSEQRRENATLRDRVRQQNDEMIQKEQSFKDLENKMDQMIKRVEVAEREKDAAVMRYASVECAGIEAKRAAERATAGHKAALHEMELLTAKLKSAHSEKQRICQLYDDKNHELLMSEREVAKVKEEIRELEGRLKWTQSKLRAEMDAYKDSAERVEKLSQQVSELEANREAAALNATDSLRAKQLETELNECRASLILHRHEREELDRKLTSVSQQLEMCIKERDEAIEKLERATQEVSRLSAANASLEAEAAELAGVRAQAALTHALSAQVQRETERAESLERLLAAERARAETCSRREENALRHAAELTAQHVAHRADNHTADAKAQALSADNASLRERCAALEERLNSAEAAVATESERRHHENRVLARKVAELTEELAETNKKLEWEKGENCVLKKKHASAIKEINRELHRALKRCEQLEAKLHTDPHSTRTGSVSSLSSADTPAQEEHLQNGHADHLPEIQVREPDRQALIERIVSLQRAAARRAERCDFLEEHARQLTDELRNKSKLLRHLLCALPAGAVTSHSSDAHKKEIARLGGSAMAALWGGDAGGLSLPLSLEINSRLQAVLEDSLLKNITLKENMDTLGEEIARLKQEKNITTDSK